MLAVDYRGKGHMFSIGVSAIRCPVGEADHVSSVLVGNGVAVVLPGGGQSVMVVVGEPVVHEYSVVVSGLICYFDRMGLQCCALDEDDASILRYRPASGRRVH